MLLQFTFRHMYIYIYETRIYIYIHIHTRLYRLYICIYNDYIDICVTISDMMSSSISKCQALRLRGLVLLAVGSPGKVRVLLVAFAQYIERIQYIVVHIYIYITCVCKAIAHTRNTHRSIYIYTDALIQVHISWNWSCERIAHFFSVSCISFFPANAWGCRFTGTLEQH